MKIEQLVIVQAENEEAARQIADKMDCIDFAKYGVGYAVKDRSEPRHVRDEEFLGPSPSASGL